jgi:hypothetical protein
MKKKYWGSTFSYVIMQLLNFILFCSGLTLIGSSIYLWVTVGQLNSFIISVALIATFILVTTIYGFYCTKNSPCAVIIYEIFLFLLAVFVLILGFFILFDQDKIIQVLISTMKDSTLTINKATEALENNMDATKIGLLVFAAVSVSDIIYKID